MMITDGARVAFFADRLACQTDVSDVQAALTSGEPGFVLIDTRGKAAWAEGHIPGAHHLPTAEIPDRAPVELDRAVPVVVYCWGPGCNGSTKAALALARLGFSVREMIGGIEYWIREGFDTVTGRAPSAATGTKASCEC
jgi:rhodanese-related sulfurtransferase